MLTMKRTLASMAFLLLSLASADSQESPQAPQVKPEQQTESGLQTKIPDQQQTEQSKQLSPAVEKIARDGSEGERKGEPQESSDQGTEFWPPLYGYRLKVTDTLLVAFTFLLFCATIALWWSTRKLWKSGELHSERELRAYVFVVGKDFLIQGIEHERFVHRFSIVNSGQTPAYKLQVESVTLPLPHPVPPGFDFTIKPPGRNPSVMMLAPRRRVGSESYADTVLSQEEFNQITDPKSGVRLYSFGTIKYEDAFSRPRFTNFCLFLEWEKTSTGLAFNVHPSEQHNDAN
jgi:hypothetical protein